MDRLATLNNALPRNSITPVKFKIGESSSQNGSFQIFVTENTPAAENLFCRKQMVMVVNTTTC